MNSEENKPKRSLMLTGAPATGKSTLLQGAIESLNMSSLPEHTTREIRKGEVAGIDKVFLSIEEFIEKFHLGWYLEPTLEMTKFNDNHYGTPVSWIEDINSGQRKIAFLTISTIAEQIKIAARDNILWVHLVAPKDTRVSRLIERATPENEMQKRLHEGDSQGEKYASDLMIDTSTMTIEEALMVIRKHLKD